MSAVEHPLRRWSQASASIVGLLDALSENMTAGRSKPVECKRPVLHKGRRDELLPLSMSVHSWVRMQMLGAAGSAGVPTGACSAAEHLVAAHHLCPGSDGGGFCRSRLQIDAWVPCEQLPSDLIRV